jgi:hypothetical protein
VDLVRHGISFYLWKMLARSRNNRNKRNKRMPYHLANF